MTNEEVSKFVNRLAVDPMVGDEVPGTGGRGKGKSGGYRTITFYTGIEMPVFLITVFSKGEKSNLTKDERNKLSIITSAIVAEYRKRVVKVRGRR